MRPDHAATRHRNSANMKRKNS